jgi:hypothetical protein
VFLATCTGLLSERVQNQEDEEVRCCGVRLDRLHGSPGLPAHHANISRQGAGLPVPFKRWEPHSALQFAQADLTPSRASQFHTQTKRNDVGVISRMYYDEFLLDCLRFLPWEQVQVATRDPILLSSLLDACRALHHVQGNFTWAMAGRNREKLEIVRKELCNTNLEVCHLFNPTVCYKRFRASHTPIKRTSSTFTFLNEVRHALGDGNQRWRQAHRSCESY